MRRPAYWNALPIGPQAPLRRYWAA